MSRPKFHKRPSASTVTFRRASTRVVVGIGVLALSVGFGGSARGTSETLFGFGPRDVALAQADVADPAPVAAAYVNPAFAWRPGVRLGVGYGHGFTRLKLDGQDGGVRDIAGTQLALQLGWALGEAAAVGGALALHVPNRSLARIEFQPGTEPSFVRFDPAAQRTTADAVMSARWGLLSVGLGVSVLVSAEGQIDFVLGQDGGGTYADGQTDVSLPYEVAPVFGMAADFGAAALAIRYRGAQAIELDLGTRALVDVQGNPLNGITRVELSGASGYVPATFDLGARWSFGANLRVVGALQLARWSAAPSPVANLTMDVDLGLSPGQREGRFVRPAYRDTLSPRWGMEWLPKGSAGTWALRAGYAYTPSPVPEPAGFASPADASTHTFGMGAGYDLGSVWGVDLRLDGAGQLVSLVDRTFDKRRDTIPFARYEVGGFLLMGNVAVEGTWR
jgi:hypothetical protein